MQMLLLFYVSVLFLNGILVVKPHKLQNKFTESPLLPSCPWDRKSKEKVKDKILNVEYDLS